MNETMDNNETGSITQWEKANPAARHACDANRAGDSRPRHSLAVVQLHFVKFLPKPEKLAINKPFECRSAVVRSPPFGQWVMAIYVVVRPSFYAAKGKTAGEELGEA
jgi:hypothetical protein